MCTHLEACKKTATSTLCNVIDYYFILKCLLLNIFKNMFSKNFHSKKFAHLLRQKEVQFTIVSNHFRQKNSQNRHKPRMIFDQYKLSRGEICVAKFKTNQEVIIYCRKYDIILISWSKLW